MNVKLWISVALLVLSTGTALAQRDLGTITGTVTDPTGAVVPGATINITEDATGLSYKVTTGASGDYTRPALKPGVYTVTAEAVGFRRISQHNVNITAGERTGVPLVLEVGDGG
jgi:protocatechuate 3,4-dioxygenase beta subunit